MREDLEPIDESIFSQHRLALRLFSSLFSGTSRSVSKAFHFRNGRALQNLLHFTTKD